MLWLTVEVQFVTVDEAWGQEHEVSGHFTPTVRRGEEHPGWQERHVQRPWGQSALPFRS